MPKRMRKDSTDPIKLEYSNQLSNNLMINDPQLICFGCGRSLNDSQFVLDVKNLPNHNSKNHLYLHKNCLRCYECKEELEEIGKCFFNGGKMWCELHYIQQRTCSKCKKHIACDEWIRRAGLRNYHLSCFNCNKCSKQLVTGEQFKLEFQDQKFQLICNMHFELNKECNDGNESDSNDSVSSSQTKNCNKAKRVRTTFTEEQLQILQNHFQGDSNPDGQDLERIATITGLSKRVTQVWFQNSRARQKKYMNKSRSTPTPLTNLNSTSLNSINGTSNGLSILNCPPGTPNSSNSSSNGTNLNSLQSLNTTTNLSINSSTADNQQQSQTNLSHSTNTNYSNNQLNSPYHSELNSPLLLMNNSFNNAELQTANHHLDCLNGSLNSLGSNSSLNSGSDGSSCNLIAFNNTNNLKKLTTTVNNLNNNLISGLNNSNFTANRENINSINNLEWNLELQMKSSNTDNRDNDNLNNLSTIQNSSSSSTTASLSSSTNFTTSAQHQAWRNLLDTNLCNTNALLTSTNDGSLFDYGNHNQLNKYFISGN